MTSPASDASGKQMLPRVLGSVHALSFIVGSVIGSGIFIVPARVARDVPFISGIAAIWIIGGLFSLAGALTLAELGAMLPRAGGAYVYLGAAYGRLPAFLFGWTEFLVIRAGSVAALAAGFALYASELIPPQLGIPIEIWRTILAVFALVIVAGINVYGTLLGGGVQVAGTVIKVGSLFAMMILPFALQKADSGNLSPVWPDHFDGGILKGMLAAMIGVLWAYDGWVNAGSIAEDVHDPGVNIPKSLLRGMALLITVYLGMTLVYHLAMPLKDVEACASEGSRKVAAEFCYRLMGNPGLTAIALIVMSSIFIALNGNALSGPRAYFAMARDGLFPRALCQIHPRFHTPANAIIAQTTWAIMLTILGTVFLLTPAPSQILPATWLQNWRGFKGIPDAVDPVVSLWQDLNKTPLYDFLYTYVIFGGTIFYTLSITSVFVLRRKMPHHDRPYRTWGYPYTPTIYLVASLFLLGSMLYSTPFESMAGLGLVLLGLPAYLFFAPRSRPYSHHEPPPAQEHLTS